MLLLLRFVAGELHVKCLRHSINMWYRVTKEALWFACKENHGFRLEWQPGRPRAAGLGDLARL